MALKYLPKAHQNYVSGSGTSLSESTYLEVANIQGEGMYDFLFVNFSSSDCVVRVEIDGELAYEYKMDDLKDAMFTDDNQTTLPILVRSEKRYYEYFTTPVNFNTSLVVKVKKDSGETKRFKDCFIRYRLYS